MAMVLLYIITDSWNHSGQYGLHTCCFPSSSIHLASSLTIETFFKNNGGGGKITVVGTIKTITNNKKGAK
jgi:hypothetical protein